MKGIFIPDITVEMFRNGCLEAIETLMAEGEVYDIEYDSKSAQPERKKGEWIEIKHTFFHKCSVCSWLNDVDSGYNFCPRCGSYNGGEQE